MNLRPGPVDAALLRRALDLAAGLGVGEIEIALLDVESTRASVCDGVVESVEQQRDRGLAVRVWVQRRPGFSFTADIGEPAVRAAIEGARDRAALAAPDDANGPAPPSPDPPVETRNSDESIFRRGLADKVGLAHETERAARAAAPEVDRIRKAAYRDAHRVLRLVNSRGLESEVTASRAWLSIDAVARRAGDQRSGCCTEWALGPDDLAPGRVGRLAAERARALLGARPGRTGRRPLVLDREPCADLLGALTPAFSGLRALRRRTILHGRLGEQIGSARVTLVDDATLPAAWGTTPVDGEGQPTRRLALVDQGVLKGWMHDSYTARRFGVPLTGHARRGGYQAPPAIGAHCVHLRPTGETRLELLSRAAGGLFVSSLMGLHTVNPTTGEYSLGAAGHEILAGGELGTPVDRVVISGSVLELLSAFEAVADDLEFPVGVAGGSTVLLREAMISGA